MRTFKQYQEAMVNSGKDYLGADYSRDASFIGEKLNIGISHVRLVGGNGLSIDTEDHSFFVHLEKDQVEYIENDIDFIGNELDFGQCVVSLMGKDLNIEAEHYSFSIALKEDQVEDIKNQF